MFWGRRKIHRIAPEKMEAFERRWCQESAVDVVRRVVQSHKRVFLDIGCGRGETTLFWAQHDPRCHVVACDVFVNGLVHLGQASVELGLNNITIVCADIVDVIPHIPDHCLQQVSCFFPDPWPKKRHHKRRLLAQPGFLTHVERILLIDGAFLWKTDVPHYVEHVMPLLEQTNLVLTDFPTMACETSYERKARLAARSVCAYAFQKNKT